LKTDNFTTKLHLRH